MIEICTRTPGSPIGAIGALLDTFHFSVEARLDAEEAILKALIRAATETQALRELRGMVETLEAGR